LSALDKMTAEETKAMQDMAAADQQTWTPDAEPAAPAAEPAPQAVEPDQAAPEPAATAEPAAAPAEAEKRTVPLEALKEERQRRQESERRHAAELARVQERLELLLQAQQQAAVQPQVQAQPQPEAPAPDPDRDPIGFVRHQFDTMGRTIQGLQEKVAKAEGLEKQISQQQLQQAQTQELVMWGQGQEAEFAQVTPDYQTATQFLRDARARQYAAMGITNPAQLNQAIASDTLQLAAMARQRNQNFGELVYNLAKASGYSGTPQAAAPAAPAPAAPVSAPAPTANVENALQRAQRGAAMATTVGSVGSVPSGELNADTLARMSDEDFTKVYLKMSKGAMHQLFGA
jgi:hypothetical protein